MKACRKCGCTVFAAHQICRLDVIVDGDNNWEGNAGETTQDSIYDSEKPYGPYTCLNCCEEYAELDSKLPDTDKAKGLVACQQEKTQMLVSAIQYLELIKEGNLSDGDWPGIDELIAEFKGIRS